MNSAIFTILALVLSLGALLAVAYPILAKTRTVRSAGVSTQERLEELLARRDAAYQALRELSFDHRVGKITDEDFVAFEANLKNTAAETLRALDEFEDTVDTDLDTFVERIVAARKVTLSPDGRSCPKCGRAAAAEDKFCAACGSALPVRVSTPSAAADVICAGCGKPVAANDQFCAACGQPVAEAAPVAAH